MSDNQPDFSLRKTEHKIAPIFIERWSPRAFQKHQIDADVLGRIMEAARWAPSCFNDQPWRFYTSTEQTFDDFLELLVDANQAWAKNTSVIGFLIGQKHFEHNGKQNSYNAFDSGAAWMSMTLQARMEGLYTHGMGGIKADEVAEYLNLDTDKSEVLMGFTIGKLADLESLSEEKREEEKPNQRKPLDEIWHPV